MKEGAGSREMQKGSGGFRWGAGQRMQSVRGSDRSSKAQGVRQKLRQGVNVWGND